MVLAGLLVTNPALGQEAGSLGIRDDDGVVTHLEMLRHTTAKAVAEMLVDIPVDGSSTILVIPAAQHRANWLVAEAIAAELARRGLPVRVIDTVLGGSSADAAGAKGTPPDTTAGSPDEPEGSLIQHLLEQGDAVAPGSAGGGALDPGPMPGGVEFEGPTVVFRVGEFTVIYVDEYRPFILGPKRVERAARVDLSCQLLDRPNGEVVWVGQGDDLALDHISKSKLAIYESEGYSAAPVVQGGGIRLVEPVLVAGIVAGLVYLFYTNQN